MEIDNTIDEIASYLKNHQEPRVQKIGNCYQEVFTSGIYKSSLFLNRCFDNVDQRSIYTTRFVSLTPDGLDSHICDFVSDEGEAHDGRLHLISAMNKISTNAPDMPGLARAEERVRKLLTTLNISTVTALQICKIEDEYIIEICYPGFFTNIDLNLDFEPSTETAAIIAMYFLNKAPLKLDDPITVAAKAV